MARWTRADLVDIVRDHGSVTIGEILDILGVEGCERRIEHVRIYSSLARLARRGDIVADSPGNHEEVTWRSPDD